MKIPKLKVKPKNKSSLKLSRSGSGVYSSGTAISNTLVEHSVLERSKHDLNTAQQELIKCHCRWGHIIFDRVKIDSDKTSSTKRLIFSLKNRMSDGCTH